MFSEALRIMDQNAVEYMVDELKAELAKKDMELKEQQAELKRLRALLKQNEKGES